jgi:hypothetical protein
MQAEYRMRVQVIRSKGRDSRFYVNIPLPLAAALDFVAGEEVQWQLLDRTDLRLQRLEPLPPTRRPAGRLKNS